MMGGSFIARPLAMLESPAFQVLSSVEHRLLARLEIEYLRHAGKENGQLVVTYDQFEERGIKRDDIAPGLRALRELGFVEITQYGRGGPFKTPNRYRLTYQNMVGNGVYAEATNEWRLIKTLDEAKTIAKTARRGRPKTGTPKNKILVTKRGTPQVPQKGTPPPRSPVPEKRTPSGPLKGDSLLYLQGGQPKSPGGVPVGRGAKPPERHPEPEPCERSEQTGQAPSADGALPATAAAYLAYARQWIAEASDPDDLTTGRRLGRWDRERRMRNALDPALSDTQRHELHSLRDAMRATLTGGKAPALNAKPRRTAP
jgi:hypothetical protein